MKVLMATAFYPRGGSAQVVKYLSKALIKRGHEIKILSGSISGESGPVNAKVFFENLDVYEVDYKESYLAFSSGNPDYMSSLKTPLSPSYEDKGSVPDKVFYKCTPLECENLISSWKVQFTELSKNFQPDIIHLHHLNHIHESLWGSPLRTTPKITQLHGTELKMLEIMEATEGGISKDFWRNLMSRNLALMNRVIVNDSKVGDLAKKFLQITDPQIQLLPNGVDTDVFKPIELTDSEKLHLFEQILVKNPQGWDESEVPGSISYSLDNLKDFVDKNGQVKPLVVYSGRFIALKRLSLLLESIKRANDYFAKRGKKNFFNVLIVGGFPGELEGTHPFKEAQILELKNVFFCGWLPHNLISRILNSADLFVAPSYFEPFGQVYLEAMATALPVVATRSGGPLTFVEDEGPEANGWFCEVDDANSLAQTIVSALEDDKERERRGQNGFGKVQKEYRWDSIAEKCENIYERTIATKA